MLCYYNTLTFSMIAVVIMYTIFSSVALTINILLLILMLRHTPRSFANFTKILKFQAVVDIMTILAAALGMNRYWLLPYQKMANNTPHPPCTVTLDSPYFRTIIIDHSYVFIAHGARCFPPHSVSPPMELRQWEHQWMWVQAQKISILTLHYPILAL